VKAVPLFQLVPLRRKNKEGGSSSNLNGMHSRTCESDSEDTVLSLSPIKLLECRASPCIADRRPSDSSVKSMGSLGSKSRRKDSTPKSRPRLSLQAALAGEGQPKHRSSARISASTEPDRRLNISGPGTEGGGASDRASSGNTFAARVSAIEKDGRGKDKRKDKDKDMEMKLGIEREKIKESERLRDLEIENERVKELERDIERERRKDQERARARAVEAENNQVERQQDSEEKEGQDKEGGEERESDRIAVAEAEEAAAIETDIASGQSPGTSNNSSRKIIKKASTSSSVSTLATSSCSDKCVRDDKEPSAGEVEVE
jgi:hypothetical protein